MIQHASFIGLSLLVYLALAVLAVFGGLLVNVASGVIRFPKWMQVPWKLTVAAVFLGVVSLAIAGLYQSAASPSGSTISDPPSRSPSIDPPPTSTPTPPPLPSTTPPPPEMQVTFIDPRPDQAPIKPRTNVTVTVKVTNLPTGKSLWVISKPDDRTSDYFVVLGSPIATTDGQYSGTDYQVGNSGDSGQGFTYYAVLANAQCTDELSKISTATEARRFKDLPSSCTQLPLPTARIIFK